MPFVSNAEIQETEGRYVVLVNWTSPVVDRPCTGGISCGIDRKLAGRLAACIDDGVCHEAPEVKTDINGKTFVSAACRVMGRRLNADLKRLGY